MHRYNHAPAVSTIRTAYGTFAICVTCREAGHCPPRAGEAHRAAERGLTCECEHESHFDQDADDAERGECEYCGSTAHASHECDETEDAERANGPRRAQRTDDERDRRS